MNKKKMGEKCVPGCKQFDGGEVYHHKDCVFYPESFSKMYDILNEKLKKLTLTEQELKDLKIIRNYFGRHDKTILEHFSYSFLDNLYKKLSDVNKPVCNICHNAPIYMDNRCYECSKPHFQY